MTDEALRTIALVIGAGGGAAFITAVINGLSKLVSGASHRERVRNTNLEAQRVKAVQERDAAIADRDAKVAKAESEADVEARKRREAEEHVAILQRQLILAGHTPLKRTDKQE